MSEGYTIRIEGGDSYTIPQGPLGQPGLSAYQLAVLNGFEGTREQWLASLQGAPGPNLISSNTDVSFAGVGLLGYSAGKATSVDPNALLAPYLTAAIAADTYVPRAGGTMTGNLVVPTLSSISGATVFGGPGSPTQIDLFANSNTPRFIGTVAGVYRGEFGITNTNAYVTHNNGPVLSRSDTGFHSRNASNSAFAPIEASSITSNGQVRVSNGTVAAPSIVASSTVGSGNAGWYWLSNSIGYADNGVERFAVRGNFTAIASGAVLCSGPGTAFGSLDVSLGRASPNVWQMGNGTANALGSLNLTNLTASGNIDGTRFRNVSDSNQSIIPSAGIWFLDCTGGIRMRDPGSGFASRFQVDNSGAITANGNSRLDRLHVGTGTPDLSLFNLHVNSGSDDTVQLGIQNAFSTSGPFPRISIGHGGNVAFGVTGWQNRSYIEGQGFNGVLLSSLGTGTNDHIYIGTRQNWNTGITVRNNANGNRVLIGTATDNGVDQLQVNGSIQTNAMLRFTGYPTSLLPSAVSNEGAITYDTTIDRHVGSNGASWNALW